MSMTRNEVWVIVQVICAVIGLGLAWVTFTSGSAGASDDANCSVVGATDNSGSISVTCEAQTEQSQAAFADEKGASGANPNGAYQVQLDRDGGCVGKADVNGSEIKCEE
jgi:hypothetical protein